MTFKDYVTRRLAGYIGGRQGQLAVMIRDDPKFPDTYSYDEIWKYLDSNKKLREYGGTPFRIIWDRYMDDEESGANADLITKDRYKPVLSAIWSGFKRAMRCDTLEDRLKAWEEAEQYICDHIVMDSQKFQAEAMKVFRDELVRDVMEDSETLPFDLPDVI